MKSQLQATTAIIACGLCYTSDAFAVERDTVLVNGVELNPMGSVEVLNGAMSLNAKASAGMGYNSNVYAVPKDEDGDVLFEAMAGLVGRWKPADLHLLEYDLELFGHVYTQEEDRDLLGGLINLEWAYEGLTNEVDTVLSYKRVADPLVETGEQIDTSTAQLSTDVGFEVSELSRISVGAYLIQTDYHDDGLTFDKDSRDYIDYGARSTWNYALSETRRLDVSAVLNGRAYDESDANFNDSVTLSGQASWKGDLSDRLLLSAGGGLQVRMFEDDYAEISDYDDETVVILLANVSMSYVYNVSGDTIDATAFSSGSDSTTANAAQNIGLSVSGSYAYSEELSFGGNLSWFSVSDSGSLDGLDDEQRNTVTIAANAAYQWREGFAANGSLTYTTSDAEVGNDFDRFELNLGVVFAY